MVRGRNGEQKQRHKKGLLVNATLQFIFTTTL